MMSDLITTPVLGYPDRNGSDIFDTDASDVGVGAVLSQRAILRQDGQRRVIAYCSKTLIPRRKTARGNERSEAFPALPLW